MSGQIEACAKVLNLLKPKSSSCTTSGFHSCPFTFMRLNGFNSTSTFSSNSIRLRCHMFTAQSNWDTPLPAASLLPGYACCAQGQSQIHQHLWFQYAWYVWHGHITISLFDQIVQSVQTFKLSNISRSQQHDY